MAALGGALGGHFGSFLAVEPAGTKKGKKKLGKVGKIVAFRSPFCTRFSTACFALPAAPRRGRILKKSVFPRHGQSFQHVGHFHASRKSSEIQEMPVEKNGQKLTKSSMPRKLDKCSKTHCFGSQNGSKNRPRRRLGHPWRALGRLLGRPK